MWLMGGLLLLVVAGLWLVSTNNGLVRLRNAAQNAFATVDVQLKQRCDLIPNVVAAVQGYMQHERSLMERLTALRTQAVSGALPDAKRMELDTEMSRLMRQVMVQVESYPELKAAANVEHLQRTLNEVEAQIAAARRTYNSAATDLNNAVSVFPANLAAGMLGFAPRPLFEAAGAEKATPEVGALMGR